MTATCIHTNKDGETVMRYHHTDVVRFSANEIILSTGGWWTQTTKKRMNQASDQFKLGYRVFAKGGGWWCRYQGQTVQFEGEQLKLQRSIEG